MASHDLDNSMLDMLNVINNLLAKHSPLVSDVEKLVGALNDGVLYEMTNEILKWLDFAPFFNNPNADDVQLKALEKLDEEWVTRSVILGDGLKPCLADVFLYAKLHSFVKRFSSSDKVRLPHLLRWFDYIQNQEDVESILDMIAVEKAEFVTPLLCASSKDDTVVEPLIAPDGAEVGECVTFSGLDDKPEEVLNLKKKQLDKIAPNIFTDEKGVATFKGIPFMTSSGPCSSSIPNGSIK